jgi:hypothetical protein
MTDAGKFCNNCGKSFINEDSELVEGSLVNTSPEAQVFIEERSLGKMILLTFITFGFYAGFFYKGVTRDINIMSKAVTDLPELKFNGLFSSIAGLWALARVSAEGALVLIIINAIYVMAKTKSMRKALMDIAPYYYADYSYKSTSWWVASTNLGFMAVLGLVLSVFAPMIFANKVIEVFNDIARQHNKNVVKDTDKTAKNL